MDPISVFRTLWNRRWLALPIIALIVAACGYMVMFGPRTYSASASYVLITPGIPTDSEVRDNPALSAQADNPYLRSDPALAAQVVAGRLASGSNTELLEERGLSTDFTVGPGISGSQQIVTIDVQAGSPAQVISTLEELETLLEAELSQIQTVNGASGRFLITAQTVSFPDDATEQLSSRLRSVIVVGIGGFVLLFGAMSLAQGLDRRGRVREADTGQRPGSARVDVDSPHDGVPRATEPGQHGPTGSVRGPIDRRIEFGSDQRQARMPYATQRPPTSEIDSST